MASLQNSLCRFALLLVVGAALASAQSNTASLPLLTHADQVRHLSAEEAALGYPVRIRGVITDDVPSPDFFVQDSTAGIYVEGSASPRFGHHWGDLVELEGVTGPGKFAPVIREQKLRVLGRGQLPQARVYPFIELAAGQQDSQWAQVRGIVRSVSIDRTSWPETVLAMTVASGDGRFNVRVPITREQDFSSWIDAEVAVEGVCGSLFNNQRQLIGVLFYVPDLQFIEVETQEKDVPISSLMRFAPGGGSRHRVRVQGVVSYQQLGRTLFIESEGQGLRVLSQQSTPLAIGDIVDVLGFPATGESAPVLENAAFHRVSHGPPPQPIKLDLTTPWEQYDGALVTTDAKLLHLEQQPDGPLLLFQQGDRVFEGLMENASSASLSGLRPNSQVRLTGICLVRNGGLWSTPLSFRLLLRSPQDVIVLHAPSWWDLRNTLWLLGIVSGILFLVLAGMIFLSRKVREQMKVIREKIEHGAVLEERNRIARELHDTLEQELAGITMQLDLAVDCFRQVPTVAFDALSAARNMSRHSMVEARRSVWDLRCSLLENGDLPSALTEIVRSIPAPPETKVEIKVQGTPVRLPGRVEMNLLRIGQEAASNGIQHGQAVNVRIALRYTPEKVILEVRDDGCGLTREHSKAGHFGMLDMRERAEALGCQLVIESAPGNGTIISVEVAMQQQVTSDAELKTHTHSGRG
ncbi:MAG: sensor histidine kinase [Terriglobales bacterium]